MTMTFLLEEEARDAVDLEVPEDGLAHVDRLKFLGGGLSNKILPPTPTTKGC